MKNVSRLAAATLLVAVPVGLTGCGGADSKPSKSDVSSGYAKMLKSMGGTSVDSAMWDKIASCTTDKVYDKATTKTLKAMASGDKSNQPDTADQTLLTDASKDCTTTAMKG